MRATWMAIGGPSVPPMTSASPPNSKYDYFTPKAGPTATGPAVTYSIHLREDTWHAECRAFGLKSNPAKAEAFGVGKTTGRAQNGYACSYVLVAAALTLGTDKFELLFRIVHS